MAKSKRQSAAQRRSQERRQRPNTISGSGRRSRREQQQLAKKKRTWWLLGGIVALVVIVVGGIFFIANMETQQATAGGDDALKSLTSLPADTYARVGQGSVQSSPMTALKNMPVLKGPDDKPEVFYMGGEYCPYCAVQRWALIAALSRFGRFSGVTPIISDEGKIPTYTFHNARYQSAYLHFDPKEAYGNDATSHPPLETLTPAEQNIFSKYDRTQYFPNAGDGSIPFLSFGNQYISAGAYYTGDVFANKSYSDIAHDLADPNSDVTRGMIGSANYITAALCRLTNNQPGNVCNASFMPAIQQSLSSSPVKAFSEPLLMGDVSATRARRPL